MTDVKRPGGGVKITIGVLSPGEIGIPVDVDTLGMSVVMKEVI